MKCAVLCCPNKRKKTRGKSFFRFPREQEVAERWLQEIGRERFKINEYSVICEDHFQEYLIFQWKDKKVLDKEAVPQHDFKSCEICLKGEENDNIEQARSRGRRNTSKAKYAPNTVKNGTKQLQSYVQDLNALSAVKVPNVQAEKSNSFIVFNKDEGNDLDDSEESVITSLEITPLDCDEIDIHDISKDASLLTPANENPLENSSNVIEKPLNKALKVDTAEKSDGQTNNVTVPNNSECKIANPLPYTLANPSVSENGTCRVCLANYFKGQSIFLSYKNKYLPHIIYNITGIFVRKGDELPSMICFTCADRLLQAESLRKTCISSDKFLRRDLKSRDVELMGQDVKACDLVKSANTGNKEEESSDLEEKIQSVTQCTKITDDVTKEHNYITFERKNDKPVDNRPMKEKEVDIRVEEIGEIKSGDLGLGAESLMLKEENPYEAQYLDDEVFYDDLFAEVDVQYNEDVEVSDENVDDEPEINMGLPELFVCTVCSKKITSLRSFRRHQRYHSCENFRCPLCPDELTFETMKEHLLNHKNKKELMCDQCSERFEDLTDLYNHLITHVKRNNVVRIVYVHECELCNNRTPSLASHLNHMRRKHDVVDLKPFKCSKCPMKFAAKLGLARHTANIHNRDGSNREKNFYCSMCGKGFFAKGNMMIHMRTHTGERPYKCKYCDKSFSQINSLNVHTYIHTGEKPYLCSICGKQFKQYTHFHYHMLMHSDKRPHVCKICGRGFRVRGTLNTHMKIHGNRPFSCEICGMSYTERFKLRKHKQFKHSGPEDYYRDEEEILEVA